MSIRAKISLVILIAALAEALLLGTIALVSVSRVSGNAAELDRIGNDLERSQELNLLIHRATDPAVVFEGDRPPADKFASGVDQVEGKLQSCATAACHGEERFARFRNRLADIRADGLRILSVSGSSVPHDAWRVEVHGPAEDLTESTNTMTGALLRRSRELETESRRTARTATVLVIVGTLVCLVVAVAFAVPIARGITRPLERLATRSEEIGAGRMDVRAEETGPREAAQLARSFNRMMDALEARTNARLLALRRTERLAEVGLIANTVAHDLNNPLANILLNAEALMEPGAENAAIAGDILRDASRCREIAREIRQLGREGELSFLPCSARDVVEEAIRLLRYKWEPKSVRITPDLPPQTETHSCSRTRLIQLFVNLIENAIDASHQGGEVRVRVRIDGGLEAQIEDDGPGIPDEIRGSMFKPFFTTKGDGTGLGLPVCKRIVEQLHGTLAFDTGRGGTVFRFRIPEQENV